MCVCVCVVADAHCRQLVDSGIVESLLSALKSTSVVDEEANITLQHAVLSSLRNLAIPGTAHTHTHTHTRMHAQMHTCMHTHTHPHMRMPTHACMHTHTHTNMHTYAHTHTNMHTYAHTQGTATCSKRNVAMLRHALCWLR